MAGANTLPFLQETMILLTAAGVVVPLLQRLRLSPVLTYLLLGAAVGPHGFILLAGEGGWLQHVTITTVEEVRALAEMGVIFLLFMIGLELSPKKLWALRRQVFGLGLLQVTVTATLIGSIAYLFGNGPGNSLLLGACLALSSTAIVMQLLAERRQVATPMGRSTFSILLFQDIAVVPILVLVGVLGAGAGADFSVLLGFALAKAVLAVLLITLIGYFLLRPLFRLASGAMGAEAFMAVALLAALGTAALTEVAGLSMALGAFLAGLMLAESEYSHAIETFIAPFKGLLLGLFFMSVGMSLDVRAVAEDFSVLMAAVAGLILLKALIIYLLLRLVGQPRAPALESGLLLGQAGEFAFVIVGMALATGLMEAEAAQFMLLVAVLSMLVTPVVAALAYRLARRLETPVSDVPGDELAGHVVVISYGRVGQLLGEVLDRENISWVAIDNDAERVVRARAADRPVYYGDSTNPAILARLHPGGAQVVVIALDEPQATTRTLDVLRRSWPEVPVFVRAHDLSHVAELRQAGATDVVPDTLESSLKLAGRVLSSLGLAHDEVEHRLELVRLDLDPVR